VAVEKVGFSEKSPKSGDRKCPGDWEKSFVELPDAIQFLQIPRERVFQQPQGLSLPIFISRLGGAKRISQHLSVSTRPSSRRFDFLLGRVLF
jgi:hypothetical protein